ncbi:DNA-directed RNA polymerase subunit beta [Gulosibacter bifidus]|uniref:DNA-directed RNA polymerase subunit beta n=1 Tax=Gulosibacter bifidus TaxID=272239 RepID=A0ABW5RK83_9MICO|nr:DNA-directed RNA polymerase subunit beta [Gulosibacter bifidus]
MPIEAFEAFIGADDPATTNRVAHDTAQALLDRVRKSADPEVVERTINYANQHGIDDLVQLWAPASAQTLPGSLWRLYLIHMAVAQNPEGASYTYRRGASIDHSISRIVAGAVEPTGPTEILNLTTTILRGAFTGDFADALDRAAAFAAVMSMGANALADDDDAVAPVRAGAFTLRSARYLEFARDLAASARLWRHGALD